MTPHSEPAARPEPKVITTSPRPPAARPDAREPIPKGDSMHAANKIATVLGLAAALAWGA